MAIDYSSIGQRIKQKRIEKGLTQEKLSELVGIGASHMSHIESGTTVPSFEVFISILNTLGCSADEILCKELNTARPIVNSWLAELVADCNQEEVKIIADMVVSLKQTLRKNRPAES